MPLTDAIEHVLADPWRVFFAGYAIHFLRYLVLAGGAWVLFYVLFRRAMTARKIQPGRPAATQIRREVALSVISFAIFAAVGVLTVALQRRGWLMLYYNVNDYGWGYFALSLVALVLIHDAWFYWTHRLMHWRPLFRHVHAVHHRSHNPSPWAAFSFHPVEALIHAIVFPLVVIVMPVHLYVAGLWLLYMTIMNVGGHLGYELLPHGFARHRLLGWHNTTVHHDMHHSHVGCNFSLYFNLWDRLMGTNHADYLDAVDAVTEPPRTPEEVLCPAHTDDPSPTRAAS